MAPEIMRYNGEEEYTEKVGPRTAGGSRVIDVLVLNGKIAAD